jgi:hypothetical protein
MGSRSLFDPIEWDPANQGVDVTYVLFLGDLVVWGVLAGRDSTQLRMPQPPSSVDRQVLFPRYLRGEIRAGIVPDRSPYYDKLSITPQIRLVP